MSILQVLRQRAASIPLAWQRRLSSWVGFALTCGTLLLLAYLVYRERNTLVPRVLALDPRCLIPVMLLYAIDLTIVALTWASLGHSFGVRTSLARHLRIFSASNAARRLPGTLWYIGGRSALYGRVGISAGPVVLASGVELALLWVSALAISVPAIILLLPQRQWLFSGVAAIVLIGLLNPVSLRWAIRRATRLQETERVPLRRVYLWLALDILAWCLGGLLLFAVIAMFEPLALSAAPVVVGAWTVSATLSMVTFFLPSGFGVMELGLIALLASTASAGTAVLAAVTVRLVVTALDVAFGLAAYALEASAKP